MANIVIIGGIAEGKTRLINREIIPQYKDFLVLDYCDEYSQWIKDKSKVVVLGRNVIEKQRMSETVSILNKLNPETLAVIDNTNLMLNPSTRPDFMNPLIIRKNVVSVFQSISSVPPEFFLRADVLYLFPVADFNKQYIDSFIEEIESVGKVYIRGRKERVKSFFEEVVPQDLAKRLKVPIAEYYIGLYKTTARTKKPRRDWRIARRHKNQERK